MRIVVLALGSRGDVQPFIALDLALKHAGQLGEALVGFDRAAASLGKIGALSQAHGAEAGAARCLPALGQIQAAKQRATSVCGYLQRHGGSGMEFPVLVYETCADVLSATGQSKLSLRVVEAGYREMMAPVDRISVPEWRQVVPGAGARAPSH
jgi:hypothetical protein